MNLPPRIWSLALLVSTVGAILALGVSGMVVSAASANPASSCGCASVAAAPTSPWHTVGLSVAIGSGLLLLLSAFVALRAAHRASITMKGQRLARRTIAGSRVSVVQGSDPHAYCTGGWRPEIAVTRAFLGLSAEEQSAVIAHERDHQRFRDPLALAFLQSMGHLFPVIKPVANEFRRSMEFAADDAARKGVGDEAFGAALAAVVDTAPVPAVGFSPTEARIRRFLGVQHRTSRVPLAATAIGFVLAMILLVGATVSGRHAIAREGPAMCHAERIWCERTRPPREPLVCVTTPEGTACLVP